MIAIASLCAGPVLTWEPPADSSASQLGLVFVLSRRLTCGCSLMLLLTRPVHLVIRPTEPLRLMLTSTFGALMLVLRLWLLGGVDLPRTRNRFWGPWVVTASSLCLRRVVIRWMT